jgi:hypothetical protein
MRRFPTDREPGAERIDGVGVVRLDLQHDPEKWEPVFRKVHAQTKR